MLKIISGHDYVNFQILTIKQKSSPYLTLILFLASQRLSLFGNAH